MNPDEARVIITFEVRSIYLRKFIKFACQSAVVYLPSYMSSNILGNPKKDIVQLQEAHGVFT